MANRELTNEEAFARFDRDGDGRPGGSLPKTKEAKMAKSTTKKASTKTAARTQTVKRGDQAPEAKATTAAKSDAAEKMFKDADQAALRGLPDTMTVEQNENHVRKAALGY